MIERLIEWSIRNRFLVGLITLLLTVLSVYSVRQLAVDAIPDLSEVQVIVKTEYSGQAPQVVEDQVTYPLASALMSVPGAKDVRGMSVYGDSFIYVIFDEGTDPYWARSRVLEYLSQARRFLPSGAEPELGPDASGVGWVYQYALIDRSGQHTLADLTTLQDYTLRYRLQGVEGVSEVATVGGMTKQYQIVIEPNRLRAYSLSLDEVRSAIRRGNQETGASVIEMAEAEYMVRARGYLQSREDIASIVIRTEAGGVALRLGDVAEIREGPEMRRGVTELNGAGEVVGGIIVMRSGENALSTIERVKAELTQLEASLPDGVEIVTVYDRSKLIISAIDNLTNKLFEELLVVGLICALFLWHFRSTLVVMISLPLGVLAALAVISWQGVNANIMSLGGIAIAIGAMVDGGIVMTENMHRHLSMDDERTHWQRVRDASVEVGRPLFFSLLIITVSFVPVFALDGPSGKLFGPLAYTKTYAMALAAALSITLVPVLMGVLMRGKVNANQHRPIQVRVIKAYEALLGVCLTWPKLTILLVVALSASAYYPLQRVGSEFMPPLNEGDLLYMPTVDAGISIGKARQLLQQTDRLIATVPEVESVFGKVGRSQSATDPAPLTMIETTIILKDRREWRDGITLDDIISELDSRVSLPGLSNAWVMPIKTRIDMLSTGIKTPVGIKISGPELDQLQTIGRRIETVLADHAETDSVYAERVVGGRYIDIDIDRNEAARFGLNVADIQSVIQLAVGGMRIGETVEGRARFPVNLRYPQHYRNSERALKQLPIITASGAQIVLSDVASVRIINGPGAIRSENAIPTSFVYLTPNSDDLGGYVSSVQALLAEEVSLPPGYSLQYAGEYEYLLSAKEKLTVIVPVTLGVILILLFLNFRRMSDVLLLSLSLPLGLVGSVWYLYLANFQWSVAVAVGVIATAGLMAELGVLMLTYLRGSVTEAEHSNLPHSTSHNQAVKHAIITGAARRIRPVLMTVLTVVASLMAIMVSDGTGAETMQRIAAPMVGGMISALLLSLVFIPTSFWLLQRRR